PISPRRYQPEASKIGAAQAGAPSEPHGGGGPRSAACAAGIASSAAAPAAASNRALLMVSSVLSLAAALRGGRPKQSTDRECPPFVKRDLTFLLTTNINGALRFTGNRRHSAGAPDTGGAIQN